MFFYFIVMLFSFVFFHFLLLSLFVVCVFCFVPFVFPFRLFMLFVVGSFLLCVFECLLIC